MNSLEGESVDDFITYTNKEVSSSQHILQANEEYQKFQKMKDFIPDSRVERFQGYKEIKNAFDFEEKFKTELDQELDQVVKDFRNRKIKTQAELEEENAIKKEVEREQKILENSKQHSIDENDDLRSSVSAKEKVRQSMLSEIELNVKQIAIKKAIENQDFDTYHKIERGEMDSQLEEALGIIPQENAKENKLLDSSFEDLNSDDQSIYNVFWEEFEEREIKRRERDAEMLKNPMVLLEKLEVYSKNLYRNLNTEDKTELMRQIERFLDEGVTPLQKYYDELKAQFAVPSRDLLNFEKKQFQKQISMIRKAQKKEVDQVKFMAQIKAKEIMK